MLQRSDLHNYQSAAVRFIRNKRRCALFIDPGLGKSITTLTAFHDLISRYFTSRMIVFAPKRVATETWPDEIKTWAHVRHLTCVVVDGSEKRRLKQLAKPADIHLISCDLTEWFVEACEQGFVDLRRWDMCVIDESSKYKSPSSRRFKAMRRIAFKIERFVLLTGTPAANGLHDLWAQIYLLDGGARLGRTLKDFRERWFTPSWDGSGYHAKKHALDEIQSRISDITFTLRADDYLELPECVYNVVKVPLPEKIRQTYDKFQREYVLEISDVEQLQAASAVGLTTKLLQLSNGVVYDSEKNGRYFHDEKIKALKDIVDEAQGNPVLVAYNFKSDLVALKKAFPELVVFVDHKDAKDRWNRGEIPIMAIHPKSAGHGLNLQHGGSIFVWYGLTWSLEEYQQTNKRLHRQGQTRAVVIHHLVSKGTIDENVMASLRAKDVTQNKLLDALKQHIVELLAAPA